MISVCYDFHAEAFDILLIKLWIDLAEEWRAIDRTTVLVRSSKVVGVIHEANALVEHSDHEHSLY